MKLKNLLLTNLMVVAILSLIAQPQYSSKNLPSIGDVATYKRIEMGGFGNNEHRTVGENLTWDFSKVTGFTGKDITVTATTKSIANAKNGSKYTKAMMATEGSDGFYHYYSIGKDKYNADAIFVEGYSEDAKNAGSVNLQDLVFTKGNMPLFKYPMKYKDQYGNFLNEDYQGKFTDGVFPVVNVSGRAFSNYDGYGTLKLPDGKTYTNVMKITRTHQYTAVEGVLPNQTYNSLEIFWFAPEYKEPVCIYFEDANAAQGKVGASIKMYFITSGTKMSVNDLSASESKVNVYPNPANNYVTIENEGVSNVSVCNVQGQVVISKEIKDSETLDINTLAKGVYYIRIENEKTVVIKKIIKE